MKLKIDYNSPFILTFVLACTGIFLVSTLTQSWFIATFFTLYADFSFANPLSYLRLFSYILGHGSLQHLFMNMSVILLIGPMLEEKYGWKDLLILSLVTALTTSLPFLLIFSTGLLGASGIAFMLIILSSFTNMKKRTIPLTFILVALIFIGNELYKAFGETDNVAQSAHILGGFCGGLFGYFSGWIGKKGRE